MRNQKLQNIIEYYHDKFSVALLKFSLKIPFDFKIINSLKRQSDYLLKVSSQDKCKKPENLSIKITSFVFYDIVFFEDFVNLKNSFVKFERLCGDKILQRQKRLDDWIFKVNEQPWRLGSYNLGFFDFSKIKGIKYLKSAIIYLMHFSPSIAVLSIQVEVNDRFNEKFENIISSEPLPFTKITKINLKHAFVGWESRPGLFRRNFQINNLFNLIKSEMTTVRKKYLDFGNYSDLCFPALQIFCVSNSLRSLEENKHDRTYSNFFSSLGFNLDYLFSDQKEKWFLLGHNRRSNHGLDYLAIISEEDYKETENSSYAMIFTIFNDYVNQLGIRMVLISYLDILEKKILKIRNYINPLLLKRQNILNRLKKGFVIFNEISSLNFKLERITKEVKNPDIWHNFFANVENIKMVYREKEFVLKNELIKKYKYLLDNNMRYLQFIKSNFRDFISLRTMQYNYKIQLSAFWLTIVVILLSAILLVPESIRNDLFLMVFNFIRDIFIEPTA